MEYTPAPLQNLSHHEKKNTTGGENGERCLAQCFFFFCFWLERAILIGLSPIYLGTLGTPRIEAPHWTPSSKIIFKCALLWSDFFSLHIYTWEWTLEGKPYGIKLRRYWERLGNNLQTWGTLWERDGNTLETRKKTRKNPSR